MLEGARDGDLVGVVVGLLEGALDGKRDGDLVGVVILVEVTDGDTLGAMDELIEGEFVLALPALMVTARKASKLMEPNPVDGSHLGSIYYTHFRPLLVLVCYNCS